MSLIRGWVQKKYLEPRELQELRKRYTNAQPYPHLALEDFLVKEKFTKLLKAIQKQPLTRKEADLFSFQQTDDLQSVSDPLIKEFNELIGSEEFMRFMETLTGLRLQRKKHDLHATLYKDTDYLLCHDDMLEGRSIAFLLYMTTLAKSDGGALRLYDRKPEQIVQRLQPKANTFTFFKVSPISFHDVGEVVKPVQRIAVAGWYYD